MAFGRLERSSAPPPMSDINMTPLIDVMLVLLVIFMITAPLMSASLKLDLPKTEAATASGRRSAGSILRARQAVNQAVATAQLPVTSWIDAMHGPKASADNAIR